MSIFVCSKLEQLQAKELVKVDFDLTPSVKIESLYELVRNKFNLGQTQFELISFGRLLKPENSLACYGIKLGAIIYILKKRQLSIRTSSDHQVSSPDSEALSRMGSAFKSALNNPEFKKMIDKVRCDREFRANLYAVCPSLRDDPVALSVLQDSEMFSLFTDQNCIMNVMKKHPAFGEAASFLTAAFHEESLKEPSPGSSYPPLLPMVPNHQYSMDFSDDEEEDDQETTRRLYEMMQAQRARQQSAQASRSHQSAAHRPSGSRGTGTIITSDMLASALSSIAPNPTTQAANTTPAQTAPTLSTRAAVMEPTPATPTTQPTHDRDWTAELATMREMGIEDEALCRHALEATNGDVQAAIDIITGSG